MASEGMRSEAANGEDAKAKQRRYDMARAKARDLWGPGFWLLGPELRRSVVLAECAHIVVAQDVEAAAVSMVDFIKYAANRVFVDYGG